MSARYSNSATLHLNIASSASAGLLALLLLAALSVSVVLLFLSGFTVLTPVLISLAVLVLLQFAPWQRRVSALNYRDGAWKLCLDGEWVDVELSRGSVLLPPIMYLNWTESGGSRRGSLGIFRDSVQPPQWRRLRALLNLAPPGPA